MSLRRILFYACYAAAAFAALALLCFPGDKIVSFLGTGRILPGLTFKAQNVRPAFPLGLTCERPEIGLGRTLSLYPDLLHLRLPFSSLFLSPKTVHISGAWHQGALNGTLRGLRLSSPTPPSLDLSLSGATFKEVPYDTDRFSLKAAFSLDGKVDAGTGDGRQMLNGRLVLNRVRCMMQNGPLMEAGITAFGFSRIDVEFTRKDTHKDREAVAVTCRARGDLADVDLEGTVKEGTMAGIENLEIDLKGHLQPAPEHAPALAGIFPLTSLFNNTRGIPVHITGTVAAPRITQ